MKRETVENKVKGPQNIGRMCFVCGEENPFGLHGHFYNLDDGSVCGIFNVRDEHQSYPGRVHGGVLSAILDELIGRAFQNENPDVWGVTVELTMKYRKPVPLDKPIKALARVTKETGRIFEGEGEIIFEDGTIAVQAYARYARMSFDTIAEGDLIDEEWREDTKDYPETIVL